VRHGESLLLCGVAIRDDSLVMDVIAFRAIITRFLGPDARMRAVAAAF
jgi:hypothetical protein